MEMVVVNTEKLQYLRTSSSFGVSLLIKLFFVEKLQKCSF